MWSRHQAALFSGLHFADLCHSLTPVIVLVTCSPLPLPLTDPHHLLIPVVVLVACSGSSGCGGVWQHAPPHLPRGSQCIQAHAEGEEQPEPHCEWWVIGQVITDESIYRFEK